jgi:hypothetical protein
MPVLLVSGNSVEVRQSLEISAPENAAARLGGNALLRSSNRDKARLFLTRNQTINPN